MGNLVRKCCYLTAVVLFCFASSALADTVTLTLQQPTTPAPYGVYISPYPFQLNGTTPIVAICDDYADEIYVGETWTATVNTLSTAPTGLKWGTQSDYVNKYQEAAWLSLQLLTPSTCSNQGQNCRDISYAIWGIFDPTPLGVDSSAQAWIDKAQAAVTAYDSLSNTSDYLWGFEILTPVPNSQPQGYGLPQEFLYRDPVPEPPTSVLLGGGVLGLLALIVVSRRGKVLAAL